MITLSNGHRLQYLAASGALAYDGKGYPWEQPLRWMGLLDERLFTIVTKTLTFNRVKGNLKKYWPFGCIRLLFGSSIFPVGTVNAVGLTNPGYVWWMHDVAPKLDYSGLKIIASIKVDSLDGLKMMAEAMNLVEALVGVQWNVSCPNTENRDELLENEDLIVKGCELLKKTSVHPALIKLSEQHSMRLVRRLTGLVEAIEPNSVRWDRLWPEKDSPLKYLGGGGVSGIPARMHNWRFIEQVAETCDIPVIGNDIWEYQDLATLDKRGAKAYSFGSVFIPYPWRPTQFVRRHMAETKARQPKASSQFTDVFHRL